MVAAGGYILQVPKDRRKLLLHEAEHGGSFYRSKPFISEPVPRFDHSRRAPLAVFASFKDGFITHIADGRKGQSAQVPPANAAASVTLYNCRRLADVLAPP